MDPIHLSRPIPTGHIATRPIARELFRPISNETEEPHRKSVKQIELKLRRIRKPKPSDSRYKKMEETVVERTMGIIKRAFGSSEESFREMTNLNFSVVENDLKDTWRVFTSNPKRERVERDYKVEKNNNRLFIVSGRLLFKAYWINAADPVFKGRMSEIYRIVDLCKGVVEILKIQTDESAEKESTILKKIESRGQRAGFVSEPEIIRRGNGCTWTIVEQCKSDLLKARADFPVVYGFDLKKLVVVAQFFFMLDTLCKERIMHGDIKLANYLYDGHTVLMNDFGGSCFFNSFGKNPEYLDGFTYIYTFDERLLYKCNNLLKDYDDFFKKHPDASLEDFKNDLEEFHERKRLSIILQHTSSVTQMTSELELFDKIISTVNKFDAFKKETSEEFIHSFGTETNILKHKIDIYLTAIAIFEFYTKLKPFKNDKNKRLDPSKGIRSATMRQFNRAVQVPKLVEIITRMLSENWEERPTINEILPEFNEILKDLNQKHSVFRAINDLGPQYSEFYSTRE